MPKIANRPIEEKERFFVNLYVKGGADEAKIAKCEKRAHLKPGSGRKVLSRKAVQKDILARMATAQKDVSERMAPVHAEQMRQQFIGDAVAAATVIYQKKLAEQLEIIKCHKIEMPVLLGRLMQGVVGIDMNTWPKEVLEYIKTAMVIEGAIQAGNTKRLNPSEENRENPAATVYTSLFNRLKSGAIEPENASETKPQEDSEGVHDLYPGAPKLELPNLTVIPPAGESIDEKPPAKPENPDVIVVEVG